MNDPSTCMILEYKGLVLLPSEHWCSDIWLGRASEAEGSQRLAFAGKNWLFIRHNPEIRGILTKSKV